MDAHTVSVPKLGWSLAEIEVATGLSRSLLYRMMAAGELSTIKIRGRRLVPAWQAEKLLDRACTARDS
jgi:predicted DNA-binding transcriptional regulator AlpA